MTIDPKLFKISFLVGDIVSRRLDGRPLPELTREDNEQLRRQLFKEITKLGQVHISLRGAAYKNLTDRIAESMEREEKCPRDACTQSDIDEPSSPWSPCGEFNGGFFEARQGMPESAYENTVPDLTNDILLDLLSQACDIVRSRSSSSARSEWSDSSSITTVTTLSSDSTIVPESVKSTTEEETGKTTSITADYGLQISTTLIWLMIVLYALASWVSGSSVAGQAGYLWRGIEAARNAGDSLVGNGFNVLDPVAEKYLAWRKQF